MEKATVHIVYLDGVDVTTVTLEKVYPGMTTMLQRGDIIEDAAVSGYRSEGIYFWDGFKVIDQYREWDVYGSPPVEFKLISEFSPGYWGGSDYDFPIVDWTHKGLESEFYWHIDPPPCAIDAAALSIYPVDSNEFIYVKNGKSYNFLIEEPITFNQHQKEHGFTDVYWDGEKLQNRY